jgi:hypothetical protein
MTEHDEKLIGLLKDAARLYQQNGYGWSAFRVVFGDAFAELPSDVANDLADELKATIEGTSSTGGDNGTRADTDEQTVAAGDDNDDAWQDVEDRLKSLLAVDPDRVEKLFAGLCADIRKVDNDTNEGQKPKDGEADDYARLNSFELAAERGRALHMVEGE